MEHFRYQVHDWQSLLNELRLGIQLHPQCLAHCLTHGRQKFLLQARILTWGVSFPPYKIRWFDSRISVVLLGSDAPRVPPAVATGIGCCNCLRFCAETLLCLTREAWSRRPCQGWMVPLWQPPSPLPWGPVCGKREACALWHVLLMWESKAFQVLMVAMVQRAQSDITWFWAVWVRLPFLAQLTLRFLSPFSWKGPGELRQSFLRIRM